MFYEKDISFGFWLEALHVNITFRLFTRKVFNMALQQSDYFYQWKK